ncbi:hypothetical protein CBR_g31883 [Chara braunii]|uniref:GIY-YIG domain-containing protein n=1 Tax=Chara braunii TaxID=69332 RepID=A0A388LFZ1_CHABU|nr:hypothetical protein CBR_g31883 [Chara braunii]|eukprot:GBG81211.1 hypothetical protein CBR_g31883 [Chara braunii]
MDGLKTGGTDITAGEETTTKTIDVKRYGSAMKLRENIGDVRRPHASNVARSRETSPERMKLKKQIEELGVSLAAMHGHIEQEKQKKLETEKRKQEKIEKQQRAAAEREAQEWKLARKSAKLKEAEELKMQMWKEMRMEAALVASELREQISGGFCEQLTDDMLRALAASAIDRKGKKKAASPPPSNLSSASNSDTSDAEQMNRRTRKLTKTEKRKRSEEKAVGNSPRMAQQAKRTPRTIGVRPVRLAAKLQCTAHKMKEKNTPPHFTPRRGTPRTKIATTMGSAGRAQFICENIRALADLGADELKDICRKEGVEYEKKTIAAMNIAKKRAVVAYGSKEDEIRSSDNENEGIEQEEQNFDVHVEKLYRLTIMLLTLAGDINWLSKCIDSWVRMYAEVGIDFIEVTNVVYTLASPHCKAQYVGQTSRHVNVRWRKHTSRCDRRSKGTHLYRWWRDFGRESYVLLPVEICSDEKLLAFEQLYIQRWNPSLNTNGVRRRRKSRNTKRRGKRERERIRTGGVEAWKGRRVKPVGIMCEGLTDEKLDIFSTLVDLEKQGVRNFKLISTGGNCWLDGWKKIRKAFGSTTVTCEGGASTLAKCKQKLELGGCVTVRYLRRWHSRGKLHKQDLIKTLRDPGQLGELKHREIEELFRLYRAAKEFEKKSTRSYLRRIIRRVIKEVSGLPYPRIGDHVRFTLHDMEGVHPMLCNAKNIPRTSHPDRALLLRREIEDAFKNWPNLGAKEWEVTIEDASQCMIETTGQSEKYLDMGKVNELKSKLTGLVRTPLDRNPGETLVLCPALYHEAMLTTFVCNTGYKIMETNEAAIVERMSSDATAMGLKQFVKIDKKGTFGCAYVQPKHKDLDRYRPICPSYCEPTYVQLLGIARSELYPEWK